MAVYTRKSTEERLDIEFNTLHAQREACEAYIMSQRAEGWSDIKTEYDDGGFSGGNMDRPALKRLLTDIKQGKVDIVVVYKIDRLTRSLMDFAKLVEVFDAHEVTFVSVTQSFNTTTSMGRLTLNVLLSFAQFEREVTSERLRDKIAASKKKGIWMGGIPPLGYKPVDKKLVFDNDQAAIVRMIFETYFKVKSLPDLKYELDRQGIRSPLRTTKRGKTYGGATYSRGALHQILINPIYIGKTKHKEEIYDGQHEAIIDQALWDKVQDTLKNQAAFQRGKSKKKSHSILQGKLFDCEGTIYTPVYTSKSGKQYHYYVSQNLLQKRDHPKRIMARLPAAEIETAVLSTLENHLKSPELLSELLGVIYEEEYSHLKYIAANITQPLIKDILKKAVSRITLNDETLSTKIDVLKLHKKLTWAFSVNLTESSQIEAVIEVSFETRRIKDGAIIIRSRNQDQPNDDIFDMPKPELKRLIQSIIWRNEYFKGTSLPELAKRENMDISYIRRLIRKSLTH